MCTSKANTICAVSDPPTHLWRGRCVVRVHKVDAAVIHKAQQRGGAPAGRQAECEREEPGAVRDSGRQQQTSCEASSPENDCMALFGTTPLAHTHFWMRSFQPMWGTGRPMPVSKWVTMPGTRPSPSQPPLSSDPSNSSCMPRQTPRKGRSACSRSRAAATSVHSQRQPSAQGAGEGAVQRAVHAAAAWQCVATWRRHLSPPPHLLPPTWMYSFSACV